ncbi:MAG: serine hydroxymethyltransferase [Ilumatobacteraceae bacterium]
MVRLRARSWVPEASESHVQRIAAAAAATDPAAIVRRVEELASESRRIHDERCINLNPAANTMNPRAEALLASGLGSRPSLGYPGDKYETGLEAIEQIEVICAELAARVFRAPYAEIRVGSGAMANLYAFMATCRPGDRIIVPPARIGGHVTHNAAGAAGLFGLEIHEAPIDADRYTVDVGALELLADRVRPRLITIGGSLNLTHHPVAELRTIADEHGATLLFDAAHLSGPIAGGAWPNPLDEGAHVMTSSAYKSLAGPPSGILLTTEATIAERVDAIAFPGLTANFDAANTAALAVTLADWCAHGAGYAADMIGAASRFAHRLQDAGVPVFTTSEGPTRSHAFAVDAGAEGGDRAARRLARANLLVSGIGLPHDPARGVRMGTNEIVRWGVTGDHIDELARLVATAWHSDDPIDQAAEVTAFRRRFDRIGYCD